MSLLNYHEFSRTFCPQNNKRKIKKQCFRVVYLTYLIKMEHSYSRDTRPIEGANGLTTRTLMVHRTPQCPSCHTHPMEDGVDLDESNHPPIPSYNETAAKESMTECTRVANSVRNTNPDDQDWGEKVNKIGWTPLQERLFSDVVKVLDYDQLARLATNGRQHEPVHRRVIIDKSAQRMRKALATVSWEPRLTQWLHGLLMDHLSPSYMASYLDILQTLKTRLPSLIDKMLFGRPMNTIQELLAPVLKKQWDPIVSQKTRKLPGNAIILMIPPVSSSGRTISRMQKWYQLFSTMAQVAQVNVHSSGNSLNKQPFDQVAEQFVTMSRIKIQELRNEQPNRQIILVGFNAGASVALQVALTENVNSVVCMGFAYNTANGVRGAPDDHILNIINPIMFVIGQNSARTSQEEMESLREKMQSETSLVIVGSADDVLRVPKNKRQIEGVTQAMVDNMITDEIYEFLRTCIINPPGPRQPNNNLGAVVGHNISQVKRIGNMSNVSVVNRKRKVSQGSDSEGMVPAKSKYNVARGTAVGRPRTRPLGTTTSQKHPLLAQQSAESVNLAIQSITPEADKTGTKLDDDEILPYELLSAQKITSLSQAALSGISGTQISVPIQRTSISSTSSTPQKIKMIPHNQFVQLKPPSQGNTQKIYTIKTVGNSSTLVGNTTTSGDGLRSGQIFTVKSAAAGTQFISNVGQIINPQKITVLKPGTTIIGSNSTTVSSPDTNNKVTSTTPDLSCTNIIDMPIIFADNDGNIHETAPIATQSNNVTASSAPIVIAQTPIGEINQTTTSNKNIVLNNIIQKPKANGSRVVYINTANMKTAGGYLPKTQGVKFTKVIIPSSRTSTITVQKPKTIDIAGGTIVKTTSSNIGTGQQSNIIGNVSTINKQFQPILFNVDPDKAGGLKNVIKVGDGTSKQTIVLKPGGLKSMSVLPSSVFNRNVTVKKVNLIPSKSSTTTATIVSSSATTSSESVAGKQIVVATTSNQSVIGSATDDSDNN